MKRRNKVRKIFASSWETSASRERDRPKLYRKTNTENEKMNFFQVSLYRKLFFDSH